MRVLEQNEGGSVSQKTEYEAKDLIRRPIKTKSGVVCLFQYKRMSDVTDQFIERARQAAEDQYVSFRTALSPTLQHQVWTFIVCT